MTASSHPYPVHPRDGAVVNGIAAEFEWASPGGGTEHHVQVSASDRFDSLLIDTSVGASTSLTLLSLLPRDGRRLYWRVSSHRGDWSDAAWFLSGERAGSGTPRARTSSPAAPGPSTVAARTAALPADAPLYMTSVTGDTELWVAFAVLAALVVFLFVMLGF